MVIWFSYALFPRDRFDAHTPNSSRSAGIAPPAPAIHPIDLGASGTPKAHPCPPYRLLTFATPLTYFFEIGSLPVRIAGDRENQSLYKLIKYAPFVSFLFQIVALTSFHHLTININFSSTNTHTIPIVGYSITHQQDYNSDLFGSILWYSCFLW